MHFRQLKEEDCVKYAHDIFSCYQTNHLILDNQNCICLDTETKASHFIRDFVNAPDSYVLGVFDDVEKFLYGLVIVDCMRFGKKSCAEVHITNDKSMFGLKVRKLYERIRDALPFDTLYCQIPSIAVHPIAIVKHLGFKKTGYIPDALPYTNAMGEENMYDIQIWTLRR